MRYLVMAVLVLVPLTGCLQDEEPARPGFVLHGSWTVPECGECFEPTLAISGSTMYATAANDERLFVSSTSERSFVPVPGPTLPGGTMVQQGDVFVTTNQDGTVWWSGLVRDETGTTISGILVASSSDDGQSWDKQRVLRWHPVPGALPDASDRPWVLARGSEVFVTCTCPVLGMVQFWHSIDAGDSFDGPTTVPLAVGRPGPIGPLVASGNTLMAPFLVGMAGAEGMQRIGANGIAAVVSEDAGETWDLVQITAPDVLGLTRTLPLCCTFPNAFGDDEGFMLTWTNLDGSVSVTKSPDGLDWEPPTLAVEAGENAYLPHAWPARTYGADAIAWHSMAEGRYEAWLSVRDGETSTWEAIHLGSAAAPPSHYSFVASDDGGFWAVFASPDGMQGRFIGRP